MLKTMRVSFIDCFLSIVCIYNNVTIIAFTLIIQAATHDLAQLINNLDLQATPGTLDMTPFRPSPLSIERDTSGSLTTSVAPSALASPSGSPSPRNKRLVGEGPLKKTLRNNISIGSSQPYAQSRGYFSKLSTSSSSSSPLKARTITTAAPLRPKASVIKSNTDLMGQQIALGYTLIQGLSPVKEKARPQSPP